MTYPPPSAEGPFRVRQRSHFLVRWDAVITCILALVVGVCLGMALQFGIDHQTADPCIQGGVCQGPLDD